MQENLTNVLMNLSGLPKQHIRRINYKMVKKLSVYFGYFILGGGGDKNRTVRRRENPTKKKYKRNPDWIEKTFLKKLRLYSY